MLWESESVENDDMKVRQVTFYDIIKWFEMIRCCLGLRFLYLSWDMGGGTCTFFVYEEIEEGEKKKRKVPS